MGMSMQQQKILFIIPPYYDFKSLIEKEMSAQMPVFTIPYGVLSVMAYAKKHSYGNLRFNIIDLNLHVAAIADLNGNIISSIKEFLAKSVDTQRPDIIAISALFNSCYCNIEMITVAVRQVDKDALIVIGGGLATNLYEEILHDFKEIEAVCYGEGEVAFRQLLESRNKREFLDSSSVWVTRNSLAMGQKPKAILLEDLDEIPFFDYSLIDLPRYSSRSLDKRYASMAKIEMSIHTSRGCPFDCVFCANGKVHGKKVRYMSVEKVTSEVDLMISKFNINVLLIEDDHFLSDKERAKTILKKLHEYDIKVEFPNGIAVYAIDNEVGYLLRQAGVTTISLAIESGSDYVLRYIIKKPLSVKMIKPAVQILKNNDIDVHAFIVTGLPGETASHRAETMKMLYDVGFDWVKIFIAIPIAGSRLYDICKENGYLVNDSYSDCFTTKCSIKAPEIDPEQLENDVYQMNLDINFINNYNVRTADYKKAIIYFENIVNKYPDHAFVHYALAIAYKGAGYKNTDVVHHQERFVELINKDVNWAKYAEQFGLV